MSSKSILSFFKKPVNNGVDDVNIAESPCTVVNSNVNSENVPSASNCYHPSKDFVFPKTKFGS